MENAFLEWLPNSPMLVFLLSISLNIVIAISGVIPSAAVTAGNIAYFGFGGGLAVSIVGEAAGAIVSFILYRRGLNHFIPKKPIKNRFLQKLKNTDNWAAVFLVLILRVFPFVPSGAVTLAAAYSKMGLTAFSIASTVGKIPSLVIEAYSVVLFIDANRVWQIATAAFILVLFIVYKWIKRKPGRG